MKRIKFNPERLKTMFGLLIIILLIVKCARNEIYDINNNNAYSIGFEKNKLTEYTFSK